MSATYSSAVSCEEVHGSRQEGFDHRGRTARVTLRCTHANRYSLVNDILGNYRPWPHGVANVLYPKSASIAAEYPNGWWWVYEEIGPATTKKVVRTSG